MLKFLQQPAYLPAQTGPEADAKYKRMRLQVFVGAFIGYAGFYLVRKNLSMAIPAMAALGFAKTELGFVLGLNAAAYALSGVAADALGKVNGRGVGRGAALVILISGICLAVTAALVLLPKSIRKLEYTNHSEEI